MVTLVDCYAPWCQPCKLMTPVAEDVCKDLGVELIKIDVDSDDDNRVKYDVMSVPTLIIEKDGKEVTRFVGVVQRGRLEDELKVHL